MMKKDKKNTKALKPEVEKTAEPQTVKTTKSGKIKSAFATKKGLFSAILIVIVCVTLVAINILSILIAQKLPTTIDVTETNSFELTDNNIEFIKQFNKLDSIKDIEIILCATKASYTGADMVNYAYTNLAVIENNSPDNYFNQTVRLIEEYPKYSSKIHVSYVDTQEPSFNKLESEVPTEISYGDVLVRTTKADGSVKTTVLTFDDLYEAQLIQDEYYMMYGTSHRQIVLSNVENAVSNAINKTAVGVNKKLAVLNKYCDATAVANLLTTLVYNDYTPTTLDGNVTNETLKDYDVVLIAAPTTDIDNDTLKELDAFLKNDGKLGKTLIYIASQSSPSTPNLNMFLSEWGFKTLDGVLHESSSQYYIGSPDKMIQSYTDSDYSINNWNFEKECISGNNTPIEIVFEQKGNRTVYPLLATEDTVFIAPKGTLGEYTPPSDTVKKSYPTIVMSREVAYDEADNEVMSSVIAFASEDFVSSDYADIPNIDNISFAVKMLNVSVGHEDSLYVMPKGTTITGITNAISAATYSAILWIFVIILPVLIIAGGIAIWIIRIKK